MKNLSYLFISSTLITVVACSPVVEEKSPEIVDQATLQNPAMQLQRPAVQMDPMLVDRLAEESRVSQKKKEIFMHIPAKSRADQAHIGLAQGIIAPSIRPASESLNRENYQHFDDNGIQLVSENPVSTFSIDVDTGSYSNVRRILTSGQLPAKDAVRVEEFINYFNYEETQLTDDEFSKDRPFAVYTEVGPSPWNENRHLMRVSLKAKTLVKSEMLKNNLVFLVDVSGSMRSADKLGLLKKSLKMLSRQMSEQDKISIAVYAGASGLVLDTVAGNDTIKIEQALDKLEAGGSTNGAAGIRLAYQIAKQAFIKDGNNRVILATDGDFNVGTVNHEALLDLIEKEKQQGIYLTTLGFGSGNYNDHLMEQLADHGNGNYAYIDGLIEAKKVLVDEIGATLQAVAKDVKIQIEFNPQRVSEYRLIGYENRHLEREDFNNDKVDAGEIGAGHSVMALYEINMDVNASSVDPLRYADKNRNNTKVKEHSDELAFVKLRYKPIEKDKSKLLTYPVHKADVINALQATSENYRFASAVAAFAQKLRGGKYLEDYTYQDIQELGQQSRGQDQQGLRSNFVQLVGLTQALDNKVASR